MNSESTKNNSGSFDLGRQVDMFAREEEIDLRQVEKQDQEKETGHEDENTLEEFSNEVEAESSSLLVAEKEEKLNFLRDEIDEIKRLFKEGHLNIEQTDSLIGARMKKIEELERSLNEEVPENQEGVDTKSIEGTADNNITDDETESVETGGHKSHDELMMETDDSEDSDELSESKSEQPLTQKEPFSESESENENKTETETEERKEVEDAEVDDAVRSEVDNSDDEEKTDSNKEALSDDNQNDSGNAVDGEKISNSEKISVIETEEEISMDNLKTETAAGSESGDNESEKENTSKKEDGEAVSEETASIKTSEYGDSNTEKMKETREVQETKEGQEVEEAQAEVAVDDGKKESRENKEFSRERFLHEKNKFIEARERYFDILENYNKNLPWYKKALGIGKFNLDKLHEIKVGSDLYKVKQAYFDFMKSNTDFKNYCEDSGHYDRIRNWMLRRSRKNNKENVKEEFLRQDVDSRMAYLNVRRHIARPAERRLEIQSTKIPESAGEVLEVIKKHKKLMASVTLTAGIINPLYGSRIIMGGLSAFAVKKAGNIFLTGRYGLFSRALKKIEKMGMISMKKEKTMFDELIFYENQYYKKSRNLRRAKVAVGAAAAAAGVYTVQSTDSTIFEIGDKVIDKFTGSSAGTKIGALDNILQPNTASADVGHTPSETGNNKFTGFTDFHIDGDATSDIKNGGSVPDSAGADQGNIVSDRSLAHDNVSKLQTETDKTAIEGAADNKVGGMHEGSGTENSPEEVTDQNKNEPVSPNWDQGLKTDNEGSEITTDDNGLEDDLNIKNDKDLFNFDWKGLEETDNGSVEQISNEIEDSQAEEASANDNVENSKDNEVIKTETENLGAHVENEKEVGFKYEVKENDTLSEIVNDRLHQRFDKADLNIPDGIKRDELSHYMYSMFPEMTDAVDVEPKLTPEQWRELGISSGDPNIIKPGEEIKVDVLIDKYLSVDSAGGLGESGHEVFSTNHDVGANTNDVPANTVENKKVTENHFDHGMEDGKESVNNSADKVDTESDNQSLKSGVDSSDISNSHGEAVTNKVDFDYKISENFLTQEYLFADNEVGMFDPDSSVVTEKLSNALRSGLESGDVVLPKNVSTEIMDNNMVLSDIIKVVMPDNNVFEGGDNTLAFSSEDWRKFGIESGDPRYLDHGDKLKTGEILQAIMDKLFNNPDSTKIIFESGNKVSQVYNV